MGIGLGVVLAVAGAILLFRAVDIPDSWPVRILDISYGGLRLEIERTPTERLPRLLSMTLPTSNIAIDMNVVWQKPSGDSGWLCGAAIPDASQQTWRQLVDAVASL